MKHYIGNILDFNGGIVRMLNTKNQLVPHVKGGANSTEDDLVFVAYDSSEVNMTAMARNGLGFLSREEVAHFMRGENVKGEKIEAPKKIEFADKEKQTIYESCLKAIAERKAKGESYDFLLDVIEGLYGVA